MGGRRKYAGARRLRRFRVAWPNASALPAAPVSLALRRQEQGEGIRARRHAAIAELLALELSALE